MLSRLLSGLGLSTGLRRPGHLLAFFLASISIVSLLAYFSGAIGMPVAIRWLLLPAIGLLTAVVLWAAATGRRDLFDRVTIGIWAGGWATLIYDVVRVPIAHGGVPVFKAISYFGTIALAQPGPTPFSELVGWSYHLSNGIGFAIMYTLLVNRPRWWSAVIWGVFLEAVMLVTPYAEIFGYRRSAMFFVLTVGSHVFYGLALWLAAKYLWSRTKADGEEATSPDEPAPGVGPLRSGRRRWRLAAIWLIGPLGVGAIGADFYRIHSETIPVSPPSYIGAHLYVTWDVPEPDRIGTIWLMRKYVDPEARFHFIKPMSNAPFGTPFDLPEAEIRRSHNRATFQTLLEKAGLEDDPTMRILSRLCYLTEITPWALDADAEAAPLAEDLYARIGDCARLSDCLDEGIAWFEEAHAALAGEAEDAGDELGDDH